MQADARAARPRGRREAYPALRIYAKLADAIAWISGALIALGSTLGAIEGHGFGLLGLLVAFLFWLGVKAGADLAQAVLDIADRLGGGSG